MTTRLDLTKELLRNEDIEGLLSMGAPHDEYGLEAEMIVNRVGEAEFEAPSHRITREEIEAIISSVWKKMFGLKNSCVIGIEPFRKLLHDFRRRTSESRKHKRL